MKNFSKLKLKDYLSLLLILIVCFFWVHIDLHHIQVMWIKIPMLFLVPLILFYLLFLLSSPTNTFRYANSVALFTFLFVAIVSIILHVFINHSFNFYLILLWVISAILPYISFVVYQFTRKNSDKQ